ncbi:predicted protein [Micromonas commoda]|uniref:Uncharacterized protein n=1 Tax=Micromonas commoda (strain RCC299 / NOUM17 / CCMP2709) TaxID=296587 RepID=C1DYX3_MICCC|nr:predicted protein [Micromonas commoda]ACO61018.1 predicted protein [Micromonas commoda]|eukprot:XP_002499760.1 predicted protein [Micromonas commoda]
MNDDDGVIVISDSDSGGGDARDAHAGVRNRSARDGNQNHDDADELRRTKERDDAADDADDRLPDVMKHESWANPEWKSEPTSRNSPPGENFAWPPNPPSPPRRSSATQDDDTIVILGSDDDDDAATDAAAAADAAADDNNDDRRHEAGTQVTVCGLKKRPALNGKHCEVVAWRGDSARYRVRLLPANVEEEAPCYDIKPENIMLAGPLSHRSIHTIGGFSKSLHFQDVAELEEWAVQFNARHRVEGARFSFEHGPPIMSTKLVLHTGDTIKPTRQVRDLQRNGHCIVTEVAFWREVAIADETPPVRKRGRTSAAADEATPKRRRSSATSTQTARSTGGGASGGGNHSSAGGSSSRTSEKQRGIAALNALWKRRGDELCGGCLVGTKRAIVGRFGLFIGCSHYQRRPTPCCHTADVEDEELEVWRAALRETTTST